MLRIWTCLLLQSLTAMVVASDFESPHFNGTLPDILSYRESNDLTGISNSQVFPFRTVGRVATGCTGTLISAKHVLTAAHCVYNQKHDVYYDELQFSPGRNGDFYPFGTIEFRDVIAPSGWTKEHDPDFDYALITLSETIGDKVGWLGHGVANQIDDQKIRIIGYPGDKPAGTMWNSQCSVFGSEPGWIHYLCETVGGMSGSGILQSLKSEDSSYVIRGVHALGGPYFNSATRITKAVYADLQKWMNRK